MHRPASMPLSKTAATHHLMDGRDEVEDKRKGYTTGGEAGVMDENWWWSDGCRATEFRRVEETIFVPRAALELVRPANWTGPERTSPALRWWTALCATAGGRQKNVSHSSLSSFLLHTAGRHQVTKAFESSQEEARLPARDFQDWPSEKKCRGGCPGSESQSHK